MSCPCFPADDENKGDAYRVDGVPDQEAMGTRGAEDSTGGIGGIGAMMAGMSGLMAMAV